MRYITPQEHRRGRRVVDQAHRQLHVEPVSSPLYVVTTMFNPLRYWARYRLWHAFEKHCLDAGAVPYTVELALRDRHHEVTSCENSRHIQLRAASELWLKENLSNIGVGFLPEDWEYVAFVDADMTFTRSDWATETVHMLQHYDAVQMFSHLTYESHDHRPLNQMKSFAYLHLNQERIPKHYGHQGAVGGAWAFRRGAFRTLGQLLDICILGSADWHMSFALALRDDYHPEMRLRGCPEYAAAIMRWAELAAQLKGNIGYCNAHMVHHWHGPMKSRGYTTRPAILERNQYNPLTDVRYDEHGVLELTGNKPGLRDEIRAYFRSRNEDSIDEIRL